MQPQNGFWKRQFSAEPTRAQNIFDVIFGEIGPVLCLIFDPFVFTYWQQGKYVFGQLFSSQSNFCLSRDWAGAARLDHLAYIRFQVQCWLE